MRVTREFLEREQACTDGMGWYVRHGLQDHAAIIAGLVADNHADWANWLIVRLMSPEQQIQYAVFAAEQVIGIYERQYPDDPRPRNAIEAAKKHLPVRSFGDAARAAGEAWSAGEAWAAWAAWAARDAIWAAEAARYATDAARYATEAAREATEAARDAGDAAGAAMIKTIIQYGLSLLENSHAE